MSLNTGWRYFLPHLSFCFHSRSSKLITDLLNTPDCTIELLLDSSALAQEVNSANAQLKQLYVCATGSLSREVLAQLLDYVVREPPPGADENRAFK